MTAGLGGRGQGGSGQEPGPQVGCDSLSGDTLPGLSPWNAFTCTLYL